jgi:lysophospholipase L1-like esterase
MRISWVWFSSRITWVLAMVVGGAAMGGQAAAALPDDLPVPGAASALASSRDEEPFFLKGGERIVFFGDSITQAGGYVADVELFLLSRFPDRSFTVINHGISSETISGTSETDHNPPRPDAHKRFSRDVAAWNPDVVVACFGMNDGNYHPFEPSRFAKYQDGVHRLIERVKSETKARLVLLTPPPFDPYRRSVGDPNASEYGYKFPAIDYDQTLARYGAWLVDLGRDRGPDRPLVVDAHSALSEHLAARRVAKVSFFLAGDAVHPGATGHWLLSQSLLLAWHAPAVVAEAVIDASQNPPRAVQGNVRDLRMGEGEAIVFSWTTPLPLAFDPDCDSESLALERTTDRLNRYRLTVSGLTAARYQLKAKMNGEKTGDRDESEIAVAMLTREQLATGVNLTALPRFPTLALAEELRGLVVRRRQAVDSAWRASLTAKNQAGATKQGEGEATAGDQTDPTTGRIEHLRSPQTMTLTLLPAR